MPGACINFQNIKVQLSHKKPQAENTFRKENDARKRKWKKTEKHLLKYVVIRGCFTIRKILQSKQLGVTFFELCFGNPGSFETIARYPDTR